MIHKFKTLLVAAIAFLIILLLPVTASAREKIYLKDGRSFEGELVKVTHEKVRFLYKKGGMSSEMEFHISEVEKITRLIENGEKDLGLIPKPEKNEPETEEPLDKKALPNDSKENAVSKKNTEQTDKETVIDDPEYNKKLEEMRANCALQHVALGNWCRENNRPKLAEVHFRKALELDPDCQPAGTALGLVLYNGKWITKDEMTEIEKEKAQQDKLADELREKGYANLGGVWITEKLKKQIEDAPTNKRFTYLLLLQRYRDAKALTANELLELDPEMLSLWKHLAPNEQERVCPTMVGKEVSAEKPENR